jgi:hypothetical protein
MRCVKLAPQRSRMPAIRWSADEVLTCQKALLWRQLSASAVPRQSFFRQKAIKIEKITHNWKKIDQNLQKIPFFLLTNLNYQFII